ncbi:proton-conducting transporter transmembrane domain-containing protein [Alishewanella longhuensis]
MKVLEVGSSPAPLALYWYLTCWVPIMVPAAITGFATAIYSLKTVRERFERFGYYPLLHLLLAGVNGAFLTGDIFNLYVWFEVLLVASFALLIQGGERAQMEGAIKYVTLNLLSSASFLTAIGLLYGMVGSLRWPILP